MNEIKPVLIVEHCAHGLSLNEESKSRDKYVMEGTFTEFNTTNRNGRVYTAPKFLPHLNELLERKKQLGVLYGEFDHPDVFDTSLSRVSHVVENAWFNEKANKVEGQIVLLNTHWGKEAKAIVNDGYPVFVSSRAAGITDSVGHVELKKLFTYDCVADPGFASARMNLKSINESVGIDDESVRLYEADSKMIDRMNSAYNKIIDLSDETKTNELFNMNKNDAITKGQLTQYSNYLVGEIQKVKESLNVMSTGKQNVDVAKIEQAAQYYESLNTQFSKIVKYLDYLSEQVQIAVDGNKQLVEKTEKIVQHGDYLAENLEKTVNYTEYLAENLDKNISYAEYLAENLDKNISYAEYLAENLDKNISYAEYLAENLDKNISYAEYIAENLDKNISYSEYIAENLDKNISYSEYIAENVSDNIKFAEYLAENLDASIAYQEYIAENVEKGVKYTEYVAECTDKTLSYAGMIVEKLQGGKNSALLNENVDMKSPAEYLKGLMSEADEKDGEVLVAGENEGSVEADKKAKAPKAAKEEGEEKAPKAEAKEEKAEEKKEEEEEKAEAKEEKEAAKEEKKEEKVEESVEAAETTETEAAAEVEKVEETVETAPSNVGELTKKIDMLISEAKKRESSKTQEPHFYKFLNKSQIQAFESLTTEEQEEIKVAMNESQYYTNQDVLTEMRRVLATRQNSPEEKLIEGLPKEVQPIWESLNESEKKSLLAQSKFYVLDSSEKIENFWRTRKINAVQSVNEGKKLISQDTLKMNESLTEEQTARFIERMKGV